MFCGYKFHNQITEKIFYKVKKHMVNFDAKEFDINT
jgi:hypothetical protein